MGLGPYAGADYDLPYVHSRVDSNTFTMGIVTLCQSRLYPPVRDIGSDPIGPGSTTLQEPYRMSAGVGTDQVLTITD